MKPGATKRPLASSSGAPFAGTLADDGDAVAFDPDVGLQRLGTGSVEHRAAP